MKHFAKKTPRSVEAKRTIEFSVGKTQKLPPVSKKARSRGRTKINERNEYNEYNLTKYWEQCHCPIIRNSLLLFQNSPHDAFGLKI